LIGPNSGAVKREIQQMEEEKQQLLAKIAKIQKRVQNLPKADQWLQIGRNLREEQLKEQSLAETLREQTAQNELVEKKFSTTAATLKSVIDSVSSLNADAVFSKMEEEYRMNKFLATVNLPKAGSTVVQH
jgi:intraflagellar transport protein 81